MNKIKSDNYCCYNNYFKTIYFWSSYPSTAVLLWS